MAAKDYASDIRLYFSCKGLLDKDITSKSDPVVSVWLHDRHDVTRPWSEVGRTERVENSLDPTFTTPIKVIYRFEEVQKVDLRVYDIDYDYSTHTSADFLGSVETTLGLLVGNKSTTLPLKLKEKAAGSITIVAEECSTVTEMLTFHFYAKNLDNKVSTNLSENLLAK
jgi:hypothetical protein